MKKILLILKAVALGTIPLVGIALVILLCQISAALKQTRQDGSALVREAGEAIAQTQRTVLLSGKLINDARLTIDNLNKAAIDERFYFEKQLPGFMDQARDVLGNVQTATADVHPLIVETTSRVAALADVELGVTDTIHRTGELLTDVDHTAKDPHIAATIANIDATSNSVRETAAKATETAESIRAIAADGQEQVHKLTHPKPLVSIANWTLKVVHALGGFF